MIYENITRPEIAVMLPAARKALAELEEVKRQSDEGCKRCLHWVQGKHYCEKHQSEVPIEYQPQGCDNWQIDPIPF